MRLIRSLSFIAIHILAVIAMREAATTLPKEFSCVYVPDLFVNVKDHCSAQYDCWNSQLRDSSRQFLYILFAEYRINISRGICNTYRRVTLYSNMFLMHYHWYLERLTIRLSQQFGCPYSNRTKGGVTEQQIAKIIDTIPVGDWPPISVNPNEFRYHFSEFTFKVRQDDNHKAVLQSLANHIKDYRYDLLNLWNSSGYYMLASATHFGCTLTIFVNVTGRTSLDETLSNDRVAYFGCLFAAQGSLISQTGRLTKTSCSKNNGVYKNLNNLGYLCVRIRNSYEKMYDTPCQIFYNIRGNKFKFKRCSSNTGASSVWSENEAPYKKITSIKILISNEKLIRVDVGSSKAGSAIEGILRMQGSKLSRVKREENEGYDLQTHDVDSYIIGLTEVSASSEAGILSYQEKRSEMLGTMQNTSVDVEKSENMTKQLQEIDNDNSKTKNCDNYTDIAHFFGCLPNLWYFLLGCVFFVFLLVFLISVHNQYSTLQTA